MFTIVRLSLTENSAVLVSCAKFVWEITVEGRNDYRGKQRILKLYPEGSKNKTQRWSNQQKQLYNPNGTLLLLQS